MFGYWAVNHVLVLIAFATGHTSVALYCALSSTSMMVLIVVVPVPTCLSQSVQVLRNLLLWLQRQDPACLLNALSALMPPNDFECLRDDLEEMKCSQKGDQRRIDEWYTWQLKTSLWYVLRSKLHQ